MADGETNKRPRRYGCHLGVAGERLAIASGTCQDDTEEILKPSHCERVALLRLFQFSKRCVGLTDKVEQKGANAEDERIIRVQGNGAVKAGFGFPEPAQEHQSKTTGEMPVGLLGIKLQRGFRDPQSGIQMSGVI